MKTFQPKIVVFLLIVTLLNSCNSVKRVGVNQHLLTENNLFVNDKKVVNDTISNTIVQKPNTRIPFIKMPLRLFIYNIARPNIDSVLMEKYYNNPEKMERKSKLLSRKQLDKLIESKSNFNKWIKNTGEAPVIIDEELTKKSTKNLENYYKSNGWFNVKTDYEINRKDNKRGTIDYKVETGSPFIIDTVSATIASPSVQKIYEEHKNESFIKAGKQFKDSDLYNEEDRITNLMRNNGVYHFSQDYVRYVSDTLRGNSTMTLETVIDNRLIREVDGTSRREPFKVFTIKDVNIYTNSAFKNRNATLTDSTNYESYNIYSVDKLKYKPKAITNAVFISPNTIFKDQARPLTSRLISNLRTFKYPNIEYVENQDTTLTANIYLTPLKKFELGISAETFQSNIQTVGFSFNPSLLIRNVFRGAETLELSGFASIGASKDANNGNDQFFDINELGANLKLSFPRIFFPINTEKIIPKSMFPSTKISLSASSQTNIGLDRQTFTGIFNYKWYPSRKVTNRLDFFNIQFVKNLNTANYFNVYQNSFDALNEIAQTSGFIAPNQTLDIPAQADNFLNEIRNGTYNGVLPQDDLRAANAITERKVRLTEDNLIFSTIFNYVKDRRDNLLDEDFSILRLKLELAGNFLSTVSSLIGVEKNDSGKYELFNVAFSQYIKTEFDYIKHWRLGYKNVFAVRSFVGIAIPYGNSTNIPFSKSFFAGGANDNRAWTAYNLGPGSLNTTNEFNEANFKIALSAEQRFNLFGDLNGALFIDAGNIWNIFDDIEDDRATFSSFNSIKDIAVGSGFGLRFDFGFFVLRGDIGFKTYNPAYSEGSRWFKDYNFSNAIYNIGINYPF